MCIMLAFKFLKLNWVKNKNFLINNENQPWYPHAGDTSSLTGDTDLTESTGG